MNKNDIKNKLALLMMIKNEEKRIEVTFDSVKDFTNTFIILDTGSTDDTINICKRYCVKNNITLHLKQEPFVNFMISRNVSLDFADEVLKEERYLLLLDCNDELKNSNKLIEFIKTYKGICTGYYLKQQWWSGSNMDSYFNIRMVKSHNGWRYKGVVHEYIECTNKKGKTDNDLIHRCEDIILFQDRTKDDDKSFKRFFRDKEMLYNEYIKTNPHDARTLFYLAQTCGCLNLHQEAYNYYYLRTKETGFIEEIYHSYYRLGESSQILGHPWEESINWYLKAFAYSQRTEPLVKIAEYYMENNSFGQKQPDYMLAYTYISMACKLLYPMNQILFIDKRCYTYKRWNLLAKCAIHIGRYKEGKDACIKAIVEEERPEDYKLLIEYLFKDSEINKDISNNKIMFKYLLGITIDQGELYPQFEQETMKKVSEKYKEILKKGYETMFTVKK